MKRIYLISIMFLHSVINGSEPKKEHLPHPHFACLVSCIEWYLKNGDYTEIPVLSDPDKPGKELKKENRYILSPHFEDDSYVYITKKGILQREPLFPSDIVYQTIDKVIVSVLSHMATCPASLIDDLLELQLVRIYEFKKAKEQNITVKYVPVREYLEQKLAERTRTNLDWLSKVHKESVPAKPNMKKS